MSLSLPDKKCAQLIGLRLRNLLKLPKAHKWVCYEWFYSNIDRYLPFTSLLTSSHLSLLLGRYSKGKTTSAFASRKLSPNSKQGNSRAFNGAKFDA